MHRGSPGSPSGDGGSWVGACEEDAAKCIEVPRGRGMEGVGREPAEEDAAIFIGRTLASGSHPAKRAGAGASGAPFSGLWRMWAWLLDSWFRAEMKPTFAKGWHRLGTALFHLERPRATGGEKLEGAARVAARWKCGGEGLAVRHMIENLPDG